MEVEDNHGFRFREWNIYQDALKFRRAIAILLKTYPPSEKYALTDQTKRALNSIVLNIAEGANKTTDREVKVYINRAHCSLDEVVACTDCAFDDGYVTGEQRELILQDGASLAKRLRGFVTHLGSLVHES